MAIPQLDSVAARVITALTDHAQIPKFSDCRPALSLSDASRVTALLRAAFEARGEKIVGRKIGFTNREMWAAHGVDAPIWGYCTDRTTHAGAQTQAQRVSDFAEPRIEPEIIFGLAAQPHPDMDESELLDCIDWLSLGYEVVQSIYPDWNFAASDTVAANALHGALFIGRRHRIAPRKLAWHRELATFGIDLYCDGERRASGGGAHVLGSPLLALKHLVKVLADDRNNPALSAGEIISTGTLTLAMPVRAGQTWTTKVHGICLDEISLNFEPERSSQR